MSSDQKLFEERFYFFERILTKMDIWPGKSAPVLRIIVLVTLFSFMSAAFIKLSINPERDSIVNGVASALGCVMVLSFFTRLTLYEDDYIAILDFIKSDMNRAPSAHEKEFLVDIGKEMQTIQKIVMYLFPSTIILKFISPFLSYGQDLIFGENATVELPPAMAYPAMPLGNYGDLVTYIIECVVRMVMLVWVLGAAIIFILTSLYVSSQFQTLGRDFEECSIDNEEVFSKLVQRHQVLIKISSDVNFAFRYHFFVNSVVSYINLAILLLEMALTTEIGSYLNDLTLILAGGSQFSLIVIYGNKIKDASLEVYEGLYRTNWIEKQTIHRKKYLFAIMKAQQPQTLSVSSNFMIASLEYLMDIIKNSYAFYSVLKTSIRN